MQTLKNVTFPCCKSRKCIKIIIHLKFVAFGDNSRDSRDSGANAQPWCYNATLHSHILRICRYWINIFATIFRLIKHNDVHLLACTLLNCHRTILENHGKNAVSRTWPDQLASGKCKSAAAINWLLVHEEQEVASNLQNQQQQQQLWCEFQLCPICLNLWQKRTLRKEKVLLFEENNGSQRADLFCFCRFSFLVLFCSADNLLVLEIGGGQTDTWWGSERGDQGSLSCRSGRCTVDRQAVRANTAKSHKQTQAANTKKLTSRG